MNEHQAWQKWRFALDRAERARVKAIREADKQYRDDLVSIRAKVAPKPKPKAKAKR